MNERIKELANRAMVEREDGWHEFDPYVFAQLIVKECALQCVHNEDMDLIEKHFGFDTNS